jgi:hypothetical protein
VPRPEPATPVLRIAHGPRHAEAELFARVESLLGASERDPSLLAEPVRVVVPSRSLRDHVSAQLVERAGRSRLGLSVQTLFAVAREILERVGEPLPRGRLLFPILVRQQARREPALHERLDALRDGYGVVAATVADLLDARLDEASAPAVQARLDGRSRERARAAAIARLALAVQRGLHDAGVGRDAEVFVRAAGALDAHGRAALPARALLIHGFADVTGAAAALLEALLRHAPSEILVDLPPDPAAAPDAAASDASTPDPAAPDTSAPETAAPETAARPRTAAARQTAARQTAARGTDVGAGFTRRLIARVELLARREEVTAPAPGVRAPALLHAPGSDAEARAVAERIGALLDRGAQAESIGVVSRALELYAVPLRTQFRRLGIPFSGLRAIGPRGAEGRRVLALLELARLRDRAASDTWLDALAPSGLHGRGAADGGSKAVNSESLPDVRIALHAFGVGRLRDVAALSIGETLADCGYVRLPVRRGLQPAVDDDDEEGASPFAPVRKLRASRLDAAVRAARDLVARWQHWPALAPASAHLEQLTALLRDDLGWPGDEVARVLERLEPCPLDFELGYDDFVLLLQHALRDVGRSELGGDGAGVQVLDVTEARARTFEHLFVLGMNRDVFPRIISEDPLLSDALRSELEPLLPDIPIKGLGYVEERYLFAQLLAASPDVSLSWQSIGDDGKARAPSPFVDRLRLERATGEAEPAPSLYAPPRDAGPAPAPRPAVEHAILAGLYGERSRLRGALHCALDASGAAQPAELAAARLAILDEMDPDRRTRNGRARLRTLGPYFGFVGPVRDAADLRRRDFFVTWAEGVARCPWQTFLRRLLELEPTPDALTSLPALSPLLVGSVVHEVLEAIAGEKLGEGRETLEQVLEREPVPVTWPEVAGLDRVLEVAARRVLERDGIALHGFSHALAERARPYLERVRALDWSRPVPVLGAEVRGWTGVDLDGDVRRVHFKADRVEREGDVVTLTDYKTGKPGALDRKMEDTRKKNLLGEVISGHRLQAAAYALALAPGQGFGRYLFATPDAPDEVADARIGTSDEEFGESFRSALRAILELWERGSFFPRLVEPDDDRESGSCQYCEVAEACLRGDSGVRARLRDWVRAELEADGRGADPAERALLGVWRLPLLAKDATP